MQGFKAQLSGTEDLTSAQPEAEGVRVDRREVLRYLGYGQHEADKTVSALINECEEELSRAANFRYLSREYPLKLTAPAHIECACFTADSGNLARNLGGCEKILVMAATLGSEVDRLLSRYGKLKVSKAVVIQAAAAAMIEAYLNELCGGWKEEYEKKGLFLRPRFSPGYGDFPLSCQRDILDALEAGKRLGITLTDSFLMFPSKSVTAVLGISRVQGFCAVEGCEACQKADCAYRR